MGIWVTIAIVLFVLGSVMALKPHGIDIRLDKLRMTARKLELNPKVIACPQWIRGRDNEYGKGMIGQYALIIDGMKLPNTKYLAIEDELRFFKGVQDKRDENTISSYESGAYLSKSLASSQPTNKVHLDFQSSSSANHSNLNRKSNFVLDKAQLGLPNTIAPFVKGISTKANHIIVYWDDTGYVKPSTNPSYDEKKIEPELLQLKANMLNWAEQLSATETKI